MGKTWRRARNDWDDGYDDHHEFKRKRKRKKATNKLKSENEKNNF